MKQLHLLLSGLTIIAVIAALVLQIAPKALANGSGNDLWQRVAGTPPAARRAARLQSCGVPSH